MKKNLYFYFLFAWISIATNAFAQPLQDKGYTPGTINVKVDEATFEQLNSSTMYKNANGIAITAVSGINSINKSLKVSNWERIFPESAKYEARHCKHGLHLWFQLTFDTNVSIEQAISSCTSLKGIAKAEPVYTKELIPYKTTPYAGSLKRTGTEPFNDPMLPAQWHYNNTGQTGGTPGADIRLFDAWKTTYGTPNVIVSVHDLGVDVKHEDIAKNLWVNMVEKNGTPGVDDDDNGFIDDINGYNFRSNSGKIDAEEHGTHVAGTIAAVNNNNVGVAGVAGGSGNGDGARIMSCEILGGANTARSYMYAADNGAVISQNSWGYIRENVYEESVYDAIKYYIAEAGNYVGSPMKGGVVIFASGNNNDDGNYYPGAWPEVIAVSALDPYDKKTSYSNFDTWVDISAPGGENMYGYKSSVLSTVPNNKYAYMDGTSMACPHVSGVAALSLSVNGGPNFTAEMLKQTLLTSFREIDHLNHDYLGLLGAGAVDANLATKKNLGLAPEKVADLSILGAAQDFVSLQWKTVGDQDDIVAEKYIVYFSEEAITENNLVNAYSITISKRAAAGQIVNYEVSNLKSLTTYYFAVKALDRWNNKSVLSNVISVRTNEGPKISFGKEMLNYIFESDQITSDTDVIPFNNLAEGILRWKAQPRMVDYNKAWANKKVNYPIAKANYDPISNFKLGKLAIEPKLNNNTVRGNFTPSYIDYADPWSSIFMIGDLDTMVTNSSAQKFVIDTEEGFNLTHISMYIGHRPTTGPIIMEIYKEEIAPNNLIYVSEADSYYEGYYEHLVKLDHQIYFSQGEQFWVVFHIPAGNKFPLGAGMELMPEYSDYAKISFNLGKTWTPLEQATGDARFVWTTIAHSANEYIGEYITLNPASGEIAGNSSTDVNVSVDASKLVNGTYESVVVVKSNDAENILAKFPVQIEVSGRKGKLFSAPVINFDNVFVGANKTLKVQVRNIGFGNLKGLNATFDNPEFMLARDIPYFIEAQNDMWVYIIYTPTTAGNTNGKITITDQEGYSYTAYLSGVATLPSKIALEPESETFDNLAIGETKNGSFKIKNTGNYPLQYFMPSKTTNSGLMEYNKPIHKYGYIGKKTYENADYEDISATGVRITEFFYDVRNIYYPLEIGFDFPFFNTIKTDLFVTPYGVLSFDTNSTFNALPNELGDEYSPSGLISAVYMIYNPKSGGDIFYKKESDKLIIQYTVFDEWDLWNPIEFQMILHNTGNIEMKYKSLGSLDDWSLSWYWAGIENEEKTDGLAMSEMFNNTFTTDLPWKYELKYPGRNTLSEITNVKGTIAPGEEVEVNYTFSTDSLKVGNTFNAIGIISNDPAEPIKEFIFNINVNQGGNSLFSFNKPDIDFGKVFLNDSKKLSFQALNKGNKALYINSVAASSNKIEVQGPAAYSHLPGLKQNFDIVLNTSALGIINEKVIFTAENGNTYEILVKAEIIIAPEINVNLTGIEKTMLAATTNSENELVITNNGQNALTYNISVFDWLKLQAKNLSSVANDTVKYVWKSNIIEQETLNDPNYNWLDISKTGRKYYKEFQDEFTVSIPVELPFTFNFYGTDYNNIWISEMGIIGFEYIDQYHIVGQFFPESDAPNALIAPAMGGLLANSAANDTRQALYYQAFDNYVVIQYNNMKERFGASVKTDIQVILYKTGEIKFQYKFGGPSIISEYSTIGIENQNGTEGCLVSGYQSYLLDKSAVCFTPVVKRTLEPGKSDTYTVVLDGNRLEKGEYNSNILINSDSPGKNNIEIPVSLTIEGTTDVSISGAADFGTIEAYQLDGFYGPENVSYYKDITITNTGHDAVYLSDFKLETGTDLLLQRPYVRRLTDDADYYELYEGESFELLPSQSQIIRIVLAPSGENATLADKLLFTANTETANYVVPISATIAKPAVIAINKNEIQKSATVLTDKSTDSFNIENTGNSDLKYEISIKYNRTETDTDLMNRIANTGFSKSNKPLQIPAIVSNKKSTNEQNFNRTLKYGTADSPSTFLGFGAEVNFISLTGFTAPENGFNLSHVSTWYRWDNVTESKIIVDILSGETAEDAKIVYTEEYSVTRENSDKGELITLELKEKQQFLSNERFWVAFTYTLGVAYPQGAVENEKSYPKTFYYLGNEGWGDLSVVSQYATTGWLVHAHEAEFKESGWLTLSASNGTVEPGKASELTVNFNAAGAARGINKAELAISSNDPVNELKKLSIVYDINQAPKFVSYPKTVLEVMENETLTFDVEVADNEQNTFELMVNTMAGLSIAKSTDKYTVTYKPGYADAGNKTLVIKATDQHGAESEITVEVKVTNANRAPVAKNPGQIAIEKAGDYAIVKFSSIFTDPDGDEMAYTLGKPTNNAVVAAANAEDIILLLKNIGITELYVKATDIYGDTATITLNIKIFATGIESNIVQRNISIFPNPATENVSLAFVQTEPGEVEIEVFDISGKVLISENYGRLPEGSQILQFAVSQLETSTYFVRLKNNGNVLSTQKIVVNK